MRYRELFERVQSVPVTDIFNVEHDVKLIWNPVPDQIVNLIKRAETKTKELRVLLVGDQMVVWDGYRIQHDDIIRALGLDYQEYRGRGKKLFVGLRDDGSPWITRSAENSPNPKVQKLLKAGFNLGSGRYD